MLLDLRDGIRNSTWLKYILVGIICVPFVFFGISSYLGNSGADYAAKVNGEKVSLNSFNQAARQSQAQMMQAFGGRVPEGLDVGSMVNGQAMSTVVRQEVLRQTTTGNGFAIGDEHLGKSIVAIDAFAGENGGFDKERYSRQLQSMGVSTEEFEEQYRADLVLQQFRSGVVDTGFVLDDESAQLATLRNQKRAASYITLNTQAKADAIEVSEEEITTHYNANIANFNNPQKVKVEYLELKIDDIKKTIEVNDEELQAYFEQNKTQWVVPEKRDASHILLSLDSDASDLDVAVKEKEANDIYARITAGESLASLAPTLSSDTGSAVNGGSLGEFGRGVMVSEFEEVAFAMTEGEVSQPVRSEFGFHIIQVNKVIAEQGQTFEEVKAEVEDQYRKEKAETKYFEVSEALSNAVFENNSSLQPAADETQLELKATDWIDRTMSDGIGAYPQVMTAALSEEVLKDGLNSSVLTVGENHAIVLRTLEHQEAEPKPVDEVRDDITKIVQAEKAASELKALSETLVTELKGGADPQALATEHGGEFTETVSLTRESADVDRAIVQKLFTMPKPTDTPTYDTLTDTARNVAVVIFSAVEAGEVATDEAPQMAIGTEFNSVVSAIESVAEVERNEQLMSPAEAEGSNY